MMNPMIVTATAGLLMGLTVASFAAESPDKSVVDIGSRRELFVDEVLVESLEGQARRVL